VLNSIYLLFNEGYNSIDSEEFIRKDLMEEAMLLCGMLTESSLTQQPETFALMALMCFQSSRNDSRLTPEGEIILLPYQDRSKWDFGLIAMGNDYMNRAAYGDSLSRYHIEAAIAFEHCTADSFEKTNWVRILELYEWLCRFSSSPIMQVNRAVAIMQVHGPGKALMALAEIRDREKVDTYYIYHSLLGEIYSGLDRKAEARGEFEIAMELTKSETEKKLMRAKISAIPGGKTATG
jgi:RNA polymerase sigma-70 factor (ECF subfamily)